MHPSASTIYASREILSFDYNTVGQWKCVLLIYSPLTQLWTVRTSYPALILYIHPPTLPASQNQCNQSVNQSVYLSIHPRVCLSIYLIHPSIRQLVRLSTHPAAKSRNTIEQNFFTNLTAWNDQEIPCLSWNTKVHNGVYKCRHWTRPEPFKYTYILTAYFFNTSFNTILVRTIRLDKWYPFYVVVMLLCPLFYCSCVPYFTALVSLVSLFLCPLFHCSCVPCFTVLVSLVSLFLCPLFHCSCVHCFTVLVSLISLFLCPLFHCSSTA